MLINEKDNTLYLKQILIGKLPYNFKVNASLSLEGSSIKELPHKLIVNGDLILRNSLIKEIPSDIIVTRNIYIDKKITIPLLICIGGDIINENNSKVPCSKYCPKEVISVAGQLVPILGEHKCEEEDTVYYTGVFPQLNVIKYKNFLTTCSSLKEGLYEVWRAQAIERGISVLFNMRDLPLGTKLSVSQFAEIYQLCTGACQEGIDKFISTLDDPNREYTIQEVLELTKDKYYKNIVFERFFLNNKISIF